MNAWEAIRLGGEHLLAQLSRDEIMKGMRWSEPSRGLDRVTVAVIVGVILAGLGYAGWKLLRHPAGSSQDETSTGELFRVLSDRHGLDARERGLLSDAARRMALEDPAVLFVRRSLVEQGLSGAGATEAEQRMEKLFGE